MTLLTIIGPPLCRCGEDNYEKSWVLWLQIRIQDVKYYVLCTYIRGT